MSIDRSGIGFIGCGKMAQAMIKGIVNSGMKSRFNISAHDVDTAVLSAACRQYGIRKEKSNLDVLKNNRIIILAVKPQTIAEALAPLKGSITRAHLIISIAAGVSVKKIQGLLGTSCAVVRVMPNTPALVGEGAAGYSFSREVGPKDKKTAVNILSTFCRVMVNVTEADINKVTALSGSGPAYVFYFAEAMLQAAKLMNFDAAKAKSLIAQTFIGAAELFAQSDESPDILRRNVTSKGGTTEKAISVMDAAGLKGNFIKAVISAKKRADELGK